jgi:hypothetical protein
MKKRKLMARIIACVLAVILLLGLIVPVVSATEANNALDPLPEGFEYQINDDGSATIIKAQDNNKIAFQLDGYYQGFDTDIVSIFIGNLETKKTTIVTLSKPHYLASIELDAGYYVIFNGGYAWSDAGNMRYTIDEYQYFYVGDDFKYDKFVGVDFMLDTTKILPATVSPTNDTSLTVIAYNDAPSITHESIVFPTNAIPPSKDGTENTTQPTTPGGEENPGNNQQQQHGQQQTEKEQEKEKKGLLGVLFDMVKDSFVLILLIIGCAVVLFLRKTKRENSLHRQSENDKYDDRRVE